MIIYNCLSSDLLWITLVEKDLKTQSIFFWIEILILDSKEHNSKFNYQLLDQINLLNLNKKIQNWYINFPSQIKISKISISIFRLN
jgi:hypothetical protein